MKCLEGAVYESKAGSPRFFWCSDVEFSFERLRSKASGEAVLDEYVERCILGERSCFRDGADVDVENVEDETASANGKRRSVEISLILGRDRAVPPEMDNRDRDGELVDGGR